MTATTLCRVRFREKVRKMYDIFSWRLLLGDTTLWLGLSSVSDVYFHDEVMTVYRRHEGGVSVANAGRVFRDSCLVRLYYSQKLNGDCGALLSRRSHERTIISGLLKTLLVAGPEFQKRLAQAISTGVLLRCLFRPLRYRVLHLLMKKGCVNRGSSLWLSRIVRYLP